MLISHLNLRIEAPLWNIHALESCTNFLNHLGDFFEDVEIKVAIAAPLPLMVGGSAKSDPSLLDIATTLVVLGLERNLLLLLSTRIIGIDLLVFELRMKLVYPLIVDPEQHDRVGITVVVIVALELCQIDLVHEGTSVGSEDRP